MPCLALEERFGTNALIVSLGSGRGFPVTAPESFDIRSKSIRDGQNDFLRSHVSVPGSYSDWRLSTHQFRKSFAQDVVRIDDTLIPAVRDHFKHTSDFVLESAYLGTDPRLMGLINDVATREAARLIVGTLFEGQPLAGKMADLIKSRRNISLKYVRSPDQRGPHEPANDRTGSRRHPFLFLRARGLLLSCPFGLLP